MGTEGLPMTHRDFLKWQVAEYNKIVKPDRDGYNCVACKNRRYFAKINVEGDFALKACTCLNIINGKEH